MQDLSSFAEKRILTGATWMRWVLLLLFIALVYLGYTRLGSDLSLENLAEKEGAFRDYQRRHGFPILVIGFALYLTITGLSLPGAAGLTLVYGWLFGFWKALVLVSFASTTGATLAFLISRYFLRDLVQQTFEQRLRKVNQALEAEGGFYLFTMRLIPAFPFFVVNLLMGLSPMRVFPFYWISQLGMLPGTAVFVYAGASVPSLSVFAEKGFSGVLSLNTVFAFAMLGLLPLALKKWVGKRRSTMGQRRWKS